MNTLLLALECPRCHHQHPADVGVVTSIGEESRAFRVGDVVPTSPEDAEACVIPTFLPSERELRWLFSWDCFSCGQAGFVEVQLVDSRLTSGAVVEVSADRIARLHGIQERAATDLFAKQGGEPWRIGSAVMPGWARALARRMRGEPAWPWTPECDDAIQSALTRLRAIDWRPRFDESAARRQAELLSRHLDAVWIWLAVARQKTDWPSFVFSRLVDAPEVVARARAAVSVEAWWLALPDDVPAKLQSLDWLVWCALDVQGRVPLYPDPFESLVSAWETNGAPRRSRAFSNELELGGLTMRIPPNEEWLVKTRTPRTTRFK